MGRSQLEKAWIGAGVLGALVLIVIGYFFLIGPQRSDTDDVQARVASAQLANDGLQSRITALTQQNKRLPALKRAMRAANEALPSTSGLPDFLRALQSLGTATGTSVQTLSIGEPAQLAQAPAAAPTTSSSAAPATGAPASAPGATAQVFALPINAQVVGTTKALGDFLTQLQSVQPRAVLITAITQSDATAAGATAGGTAQSTLALTMQAYVAPTDTVEAQQLSASASAAP